VKRISSQGGSFATRFHIRVNVARQKSSDPDTSRWPESDERGAAGQEPSAPPSGVGDRHSGTAAPFSSRSRLHSGRRAHQGRRARRHCRWHSVLPTRVVRQRPNRCDPRVGICRAKWFGRRVLALPREPAGSSWRPPSPEPWRPAIGFSIETSCGLTFFPGATSGRREAGGNAYWLSSRCFYCIVNGRLAVIGKTNLLRSRRGAAPWLALLGGVDSS
jgi:hypothetical protein